MRAHIIENGAVVNTVEVESLDVIPNLIAATEGGIGWMWDGTTLTAPPELPKTRDQLKAERTAAVEAIKVTTTAGNTFDGDEVSQGRMARAIVTLNANPGSTVNWILADNTVIQATAAELTEALTLAGTEQANLWVIE
jgi:biopolymer transport protein ExbD